MPKIDELFYAHRAKSDLFSEYESGDVSYVGNTTADNGIVGYVTPLASDRIFYERAIVVSAFCDATLHVPPFVACGRAGNGLVVLVPRHHMTRDELAHYAAFINAAVKWRFNWYRQVTADRLGVIDVPEPTPNVPEFSVAKYLPANAQQMQPTWTLSVRPFALGALFDLVPGNYHNLSELASGAVPVVSCGSEDNGVAGHYGVSKHLHRNRLTIALNGSPLATKYHPYTFAAKDDVAVCLPRESLGLASLLFIQATLEMERWRYSYYRKCYINKLKRFAVNLPSAKGSLDQETMRRVVERAPYWEYISGSSPR
jgi:hypothetical protein